jgi:hypothetical protein
MLDAGAVQNTAPRRRATEMAAAYTHQNKDNILTFINAKAYRRARHESIHIVIKTIKPCELGA